MPGAPFAWTKAGLELEIGGLRRLEYLAAPFSPASIVFSVVFLWQRDYWNQFCLNQFKILSPNEYLTFLLRKDAILTSG
jgi:hypothetical protein